LRTEKGTEGLWELTQLTEIRKERGFPQQLEKASHKTLSFFTVPTGPATRIFNIQNSLQAVIYLKKAKFRSEEWGAPQFPLLATPCK
jgi:hypothetical protein